MYKSLQTVLQVLKFTKFSGVEGVNSLMFLRSKRVGFYGGIVKYLKNRKLNSIFNAIKYRINAFHNKGCIKTKSQVAPPTMDRTGKLRLYGVFFFIFSVYRYIKEQGFTSRVACVQLPLFSLPESGLYASGRG